MVERVTILPPQSHMGAISEEARFRVIETSPLKGVYDREPADDVGEYEKQNAQAAPKPPEMEYFYVNGMWYARPKAD